MRVVAKEFDYHLKTYTASLNSCNNSNQQYSTNIKEMYFNLKDIRKSSDDNFSLFIIDPIPSLDLL